MVSPIETRTAPSACRAISPASIVMLWGPYGKDLLTTLKLRSSNGEWVRNTTRAARAGRRPSWSVECGRKARGQKGSTHASHLLPLDSAAKSQALDELLVLLRLGRFQVIEELAPLVDELHEPASGRMIALVRGKMLPQSIDPLRKERNLHFGGTGIRRITAELRDDPALSLTG